MPSLGQSAKRNPGLQIVARSGAASTDRELLPTRVIGDFLAHAGARKLESLRQRYRETPTGALEVLLTGICRELVRMRRPAPDDRRAA